MTRSWSPARWQMSVTTAAWRANFTYPQLPAALNRAPTMAIASLGGRITPARRPTGVSSTTPTASGLRSRASTGSITTPTRPWARKGAHASVGAGIETQYHQTTWCANEAIAFMSEPREGPWLMSVNPFDPHPQGAFFSAPQEYLDRYNPLFPSRSPLSRERSCKPSATAGCRLPIHRNPAGRIPGA